MKLHKNMGVLDRTIRLLIAVVLVILYLTGRLSGAALIISGIGVVVFVATSLVGFCPLYLPFGISTCKR